MRTLELVCAQLIPAGVPFKVAKTMGVLHALNEGRLGASQVGKFITVYPATDRQANEVATLFQERLAEVEGPAVPTDFPLGGPVYTRYGGFNPILRRNRLGHIEKFIRSSSGDLVRDSYEAPPTKPDEVKWPFSTRQFGDAGRASSNSGLLLHGTYLVTGVLKAATKGIVLEAICLRDQGDVRACVLKEARAHTVSDELGRDARDRLRRQLSVGRKLRDVAGIVIPIEYFEMDEHGYLVSERAPGNPLAVAPVPLHARSRTEREHARRILLSLCRTVRAMHSRGVAHRDVTPNNMVVTGDGEVTLVDLELAWEATDPERPFYEGTPGYVAPEQVDRTDIADPFSSDRYSIGAVAAHLFTALDPRLLDRGSEEQVIRRLMAHSGVDERLAGVTARLLSSDPTRRPGLHALEAALAEWSLSLPTGLSIPTPELVASAASGLFTHSESDSSGLWISSVTHTKDRNQPPDYDVFRSCYRGIAGALYLIARLSKGGIRTIPDERVAQLTDWLLRHEATPDDQMPGLHFGEAGVAVAICELVSAGRLTGGDWLDPYLDEALNGPLDWPDLTHGAAGQGLAALICASLLGKPNLNLAARRCAQHLIDTQEADGSWRMPQGVEGMSGKKLTGFAHGVAGIAYFLLSYGATADELEADRAAERALRWLADHARPTPGGGMCWPTEAGGTDVWHWWCHGGPGIALAFLRAFATTGQSRYEELVRGALDALPRNLSVPNLTQCHGLAGVGEVYLEAGTLLSDPAYRHEAHSLASRIAVLADSRTAGRVWLAEDMWIPTVDLMTGSGGVVHFLARVAGLDGFGSPPLLL